MKYAYRYCFEAGSVVAEEENGALVRLFFGGSLPPDAVEEETPLLKETARQLGQYFAGSRRRFELPLSPGGTAFQQAVYKALQDIPYGETRSYKQIAGAVGSPNASRAVGMANHRNPIGVIIPCHRVVGSNGKLTGYAYGLEVKERLLDLERRGKPVE